MSSRRTFLATGLGTAAALALKPAFGQSQDLAGLTLKQASDLLRTKAASPIELTQACLQRIEKYNPAFNAFITVTKDQALLEPAKPKRKYSEADGAGRCTECPSP